MTSVDTLFSSPSTLSDPLLDAAPPSPNSMWYGQIVVAIVLIFSSLGMVMLKTAEMQRSVAHLCAGYAFEFCAFLFYPVALHFVRMRTVVVCWSACSNITAYVAGVMLFGEEHSRKAAAGCMLNIVGVALVATS